MVLWLRQSTSVDVGIGPFVDSTDGNTQETALTLTQPDIRLKKNNGNWAQKAAAQTLTHEEAGWYELTLDATDTNTLGILIVAVHESGALPVWDKYMVVPANVYDSFVVGSDALDVSLIQWLGAAPNALLAGRPDVSVGAMGPGTIIAATFGAGAIDANAIAPDAIGSSELAASAVTEIQSGLSTAAALATIGAYIDTEVAAILAIANKLDTALELDGAVYRYTTNALEQGPGGGSAPTAAQNAAAVWDLAIAGHTTVGTFGAKLNGLSGASGSGSISVTGTITSGGNPVDGALVWITTDAAGTNTIASGVTDALGHVTLFLDAGTYYKWAQRGGINFIEGASFVVA